MTGDGSECCSHHQSIRSIMGRVVLLIGSIAVLYKDPFWLCDWIFTHRSGRLPLICPTDVLFIG